ncbi:MAG: hypothetical protein QNK36_04735 [Colwellia sp.]|jgi:hypothetical protein|nr:hypothetical protein [Colwellia sp.]
MLDSILAQIPEHIITNTWFILWGSSFIFALIISFPPSQLKRRKQYIITCLLYALIQVVFIIITVESIQRTAAVDDGAALMLVPGMVALPSILIVFILSLRGLFLLVRVLWRYVSNKNTSNESIQKLNVPDA